VTTSDGVYVCVCVAAVFFATTVRSRASGTWLMWPHVATNWHITTASGTTVNACAHFSWYGMEGWELNMVICSACEDRRCALIW